MICDKKFSWWSRWWWPRIPLNHANWIKQIICTVRFKVYWSVMRKKSAYLCNGFSSFLCFSFFHPHFHFSFLFCINLQLSINEMMLLQIKVTLVYKLFSNGKNHQMNTNRLRLISGINEGTEIQIHVQLNKHKPVNKVDQNSISDYFPKIFMQCSNLKLTAKVLGIEY